MKKIFFLAMFFLVTTVFAQKQSQLFDNSWKKDEIANLQKGEIVIRNIRSAKKISILRNKNSLADELVNTFTELSPAYLAEIIYKMPKAGNENIIEQAVRIFEDVNLYKEIIYTDEKKGKNRKLFPTVEIKNKQYSMGKICIATHLRMDMLSGYDSELTIKYNRSGFFFEQRNIDPLKWRSFTAVKSEKMIAGICCFEYDGEYYVYALGGIKAPKIPLVMYEIERQFIGRIEDFTIFYINRFDIKR